jgi:hypothetical protein
VKTGASTNGAHSIGRRCWHRQKALHIGLQAAAPAQAASSPQVTYLKPPKTAKPKRPSGGASSAGR